MPTLEATPGAPDANSFVDMDRALEILDTLPWQGSWPKPTAASAFLGAGDNGVVTITVAEPGSGGNALTVEAVLAAVMDAPMSAALTGSKLTVTLGTDGTGAAAPAKNTALLVAGAVEALPEFTALSSGTGATAVPVTAERPFTGGDDRADDIARLLITATRWIRAKTCWTGTPSTTTQALPWPRVGMADGNGNAIPDDVIPEDLEFATVTLGVMLAKEDVTAGNEVALQGITKIKAGPVELNFKDEIAVTPLPGQVSSMFPASWLCPAPSTATPFMFAIT
jgi:hypothetical protein